MKFSGKECEALLLDLSMKGQESECEAWQGSGSGEPVYKLAAS